MNPSQSDRMLRRGEVEQLCGLATTTIYRKMKDGSFPSPVRVGARAVRWPESEILRWLSECPRARGHGGYTPAAPAD